ncbi:hypothetical protein P154DRAFT_366472 [Amniculicola lignicola CBS 123094]|uniref:Cell wall protein n=1 Tax=Amniculicola lignicola CBS 123094 TaxID=1392246 RepID=A0A6A5W107_9PLEO|nr:hypothetical protein P154DRAFT_366472 [Amniculicola lignicola CBS 123094]
MRSVSFLIVFFLAFASSAFAYNDFYASLQPRKNHNGTKGNSINKQCKTLNKLEKLTALASNQTKLDAMIANGKLDDAEVTELKAKAANATAELQTMMANSTLVSTCLVVDAHQKAVSECKTMSKWEKWAAMAGNTTAITALATKKGLNATQTTKLEEKIANATAKLQTMMANTTLVDLCNTELKAVSGGEAASSTGSATAAQSTGGAATIQAMPYVSLVIVAGIFAAFL